MSNYTKADKLFRQVLIKEAEKKGGKIYCPLSNLWLPPEMIHVCHFIPRSIIHLRYDKRNCILCSAYSNVQENNIINADGESLHIQKYKKYLGEEKIKILEYIRKNGEKLLPLELSKLIEQWKEILQ